MTLSEQEALNSLSFKPVDNERLAELCGQFDEHLRLLESHLGIEIQNRGHVFRIAGNRYAVAQAEYVLNAMYDETAEEGHLDPGKVHLYLQEAANHAQDQIPKKKVAIRTPHGYVTPRGPNQTQYLNNIFKHAVNFAIGPAGTGKTYLAVACAVDALEKDKISRIILVRPAVEAGERLGFLPGDLAQKVDPYLRPLYDALYEMLGFEKVAKLVERNAIEIAPLAYMRGRTLNDAFIILDESQNTTKEQMKMFLTRIGFGSITVITGDITQIDLPKGVESGLCHALDVLKGVEGISFNRFSAKDVVRHPIVQKIVTAYNSHENQSQGPKK